MPTSEPDSERRLALRAQRAVHEMRRAERFAERGQVAEAIQSLEQAMQFGADRYTCYLRLARLYQTRQQWEEAVSAAEKAIAENPAQLSAREAVIALYLEARDYPRAIEASKALLKLSPRHVPARDALGAAYIGLGDVNAAIRVVNDLVRLDPTNPTHRFTKALLCQHQGEVRTAVEELERVLEMAEEEELVESAREQLDALDSFQLTSILTLAFEDAVFRAKLLCDSESAIAERGFRLSEGGSQRLQEVCAQELSEMEWRGRPNLYQ